MTYKPFKDKKLSHLGMGAMRLPTVGERGPIDEKKARVLIEYAYEHGINYFDTAYRYHNGESETFLSSILRQYPRETWYLATKFPGHMLQHKNSRIEGIGYLANKSIESPAQIFEEQLKRCGVDYFDFYLLHNVCETAYDFYTDQKLRLVEYFQRQIKEGRIRHLGISAHGRAETIDKFLSANNCIEFVQIQLNYLDWFLQDAGRKYEVITKHDLSVIAMEPVRGGRLASLSKEADAMLKEARPGSSIVSWAFRFLQSLQNVSVILSGMTTMEQLVENLALFSKKDPLSAKENELLDKAARALFDSIPCTGCGYCCEACPQSLDIPKLISMNNELRFGNANTLRSFTLKAMNQNELPAACIACGGCVKLCPQGIDIPSVMKEFTDKLGEN